MAQARKIYTVQPGKPEQEIGEGRSCTNRKYNNKNVYAWTEKGNVIVMKPDGAKINMGKGILPLLQSLNNEKVICVLGK